MELIVDEEIRGFNPFQLEPVEIGELERSLLAYGCWEPIKTWRGRIIDGFNRYELCQKHGLAFKTVEIDLPDMLEVEKWVRLTQLGRRNLKPDNFAYSLAKLRKCYEPPVGWTQGATTETGGTIREVAAAAGVNKSTVVRATEYANALDKLDEKTPGTRKEVLSGKKKMSRKKVVAAAKALDRHQEASAEPEPDQSLISVQKTPQEEIDDLLSVSMGAASKIQEVRKMLTSIGKSLKEIASQPGGEILEGAMSRIDADMKNLDRELRFAKPHAACNYCNSRLPKVATCEGCSGRGWVNESVFKVAPGSPEAAKAKLDAIDDKVPF